MSNITLDKNGYLNYQNRILAENLKFSYISEAKYVGDNKVYNITMTKPDNAPGTLTQYNDSIIIDILDGNKYNIKL